MALEMADPEAKRAAEEARLEASQATDPEVKAVLLEIARACERLAQIVAKPQRRCKPCLRRRAVELVRQGASSVLTGAVCRRECCQAAVAMHTRLERKSAPLAPLERVPATGAWTYRSRKR